MIKKTISRYYPFKQQLIYVKHTGSHQTVAHRWNDTIHSIKNLYFSAKNPYVLEIIIKLSVTVKGLGKILGRPKFKGILWPFEFKGVTRLIRSSIKKTGSPQPPAMKKNLMIQSHQRSILYNHLQRLKDYWDPIKVNCRRFSVLDSILPNPTIPEDDLPRMAKSLKMHYWDRPSPGLRHARFGQEHQLPWSGVTGKSIC